MISLAFPNPIVPLYKFARVGARSPNPHYKTVDGLNDGEPNIGRTFAPAFHVLWQRSFEYRFAAPRLHSQIQVACTNLVIVGAKKGAQVDLG
jgi:hypothetical protein